MNNSIVATTRKGSFISTDVDHTVKPSEIIEHWIAERLNSSDPIVTVTLYLRDTDTSLVYVVRKNGDYLRIGTGQEFA